MSSAKVKTYGFGYDPILTQNHFYVIVPAAFQSTRSVSFVQVYERYGWTDGAVQIMGDADKLRIEMHRSHWDLVKGALTFEFNKRLKEGGLKVGRFLQSGTPVERLFGKEMMVLLWSIEQADHTVIPTAVRNWSGCLPEERWWLYTMTNAASGELYERKGWRAALKYIMCENPLVI